MTLREVLNLADHEVWLRVRPHKHTLVAGESDPEDIVVWSADWIMNSFLPPETGLELEKYLDWDADDLSIEFHPVGREKPTPMLVINAYEGKPT